MQLSRFAVALLFSGSCCWAQESPGMQQILERLARLEDQNRELLSEIRELRAQVNKTPAAPEADAALAERVEVVEQRVAEQAQTKVETQHKLPIQLTGMLLFNAFANGRNSGTALYPTTAAATTGPASDGATLRQTVLGLKFDGPEIVGGGKVNGTVYMDFFAGTGSALDQQFRLRVATLDFAWKNTTITVGQDKPIISPREPTSLAQVGVSPLTSAGNLWLWEPQLRIEHRLSLGENSGLRAQAGVYQTGEGSNRVPAEYAPTLGTVRPAAEGRFEFWRDFGEGRRFEIAPGFHMSESHVAGQSVPSRIFSIDWLFRPVSRVDLSGAFFTGENVDVLGGLREGISITYERAKAVAATGGWAQLATRVTPRLSVNLFAGEENARARDLANGGIVRNLNYGGNFIYRLGSNVLASFEASQVRTTYLGTGTRINPHYDVALGYLF